MEKDKQDKRVYLGFIPAVLLCLTLISIYMVCGLFARYTLWDSNSDSGEVAAFVFNVKNATSTDKLINLNDINKPGKKVTYTFKVTNKDISNTVAEVDIGYTEPHKMKASISFGNGEADAQEFGLSVADFDGVIITSKDLYPLDETSLIWYDTEPKTKTDGNVDDKSADYKVVKKKPSLNFDKFLIKKLVK